jgi:LytS/YehU family sensor histidine kinase
VVSTPLIWNLGYRFLTGFVVLSRAENLSRQSRQRATDLELALRSSELRELARLGEQVKPHFLFNALTAVVACRHDPDAVSEVTGSLSARGQSPPWPLATQATAGNAEGFPGRRRPHPAADHFFHGLLSEYLRFCLATTDRHEPLERALDAIEHLLVVHQARLQSAIEYRIDSTPEARVLPVPPMLIGPLVENALKYGSRTSPPPLTISVDARIDDGRLRVAVVNSGTWIDGGDDRGSGTGLANLRRRLELADIVGATVTTAAKNGTVTAEITLPIAACTAVADAARRTADRR